MDLRERTSFTDYFVIVSGDNAPQIQALTERIEEAMSAEGERPLGVEGRGGTTWVLMDYGDVVVHIFDHETRQFYDLERFWLDAPRVNVEDDARVLGGENPRTVHS